MNKIIFLVICLLLSIVGIASAQTRFTMPPPAGVYLGGYQVVNSCGSASLTAGWTVFGVMDTTGVICTSAGGGGGGSTNPFTPNGNYTTLTATAASSASTALPAGATVAFQNTSNVDVSCVLSAGAATATTNKLIVHGGSTTYFAVGSNVNAACINQVGTDSNVIGLAGGTGLGTSFGTIDVTGLLAQVQGTAASGAALSGNPVRIGMSDGTNAQNWLAAIALADGVNGNNTGAVANWLWNGTTYDRARGDATNGAWVNVKNTLTAISMGDGITTGNFPSGSPVFAGLFNGTTYDRPRSAGPTGFTGVTVTPISLANGHALLSGTTAAMVGTTSTQLITAIASTRIYINRIKCNNTSSTATLVQIRDGSAGSVLDTLAAGATYGGEQGTGPTPLFWTTAGNALFAQNVTTGASVICTASGYAG